MAAEEERVKRPPNAWILFRTYYGGTQPVYPDGTRIPQNQISTVASKIWNKFNESQRRPWEEQADQAKVAHMVAHPNWRYRPRSKAIKEQQKLEERMAKAAAREEAKKAKQAAKRGASGAATAGGVKRSPSRRLSPAMGVSPYPCVSPLPGISLANFGPSPPVSAASSPMVGSLALPAVAEQSPAATLVGSPDQPKYPVLTLDSHAKNNTNTTTTPALIPTLTINDANDSNNEHSHATDTENKSSLDLNFEFFASQFNADGGLLHGGFGMNGMGGDMTADWATPGAINNLGLMENSNLSFPLAPELFGDFTGWAQNQIAENDNGLSSVAATPAADHSGSGSANTTPDTSFELPFVFNMEGGFGFGPGIGGDPNGALVFDNGLDLHLNLNVDLGSAVPQPGNAAGGNGNGYFQDPYAGVNNFGGFDFSLLSGDFEPAAVGNDADWTNGMGMNVNFDAFSELVDPNGVQGEQYQPKQEEDEEDQQTEKHNAPIATLVSAATPAPAASSHASPDTYASPSSYALQPVENLTDTPHSSSSSSAASTPGAHGFHRVYVPPKGAGNGNRRVAASFKAPPVPLRTASYGWVPSAGGNS
ncbi:hypothetical protein D9619_002265 [Psilocybe cf. subviscida]|uniref:HMG box domain-containing protein n=1 Tax=Psilocybe cf. subviscida TaxID=2480587 RepID=A0A8H5BF11_9AGAR|nr:hypothetical protein D9619_002265 [Psilocybe cf. subviscida]